jgi:hypothetical protein
MELRFAAVVVKMSLLGNYARSAIVLFPSLGILLYVFKDQRRGNEAASSSKVQP